MSTFTPMAPGKFPGHPADSPPADTLSTAKNISNGSTDSRVRSLAAQDCTLRLDPAEPATAEPELALETAISVLAQSSVAELRFLRVDENEDTIHLSGSVRSYYHKQLAQETIRPIAAGRQVVNRVNVREHA